MASHHRPPPAAPSTASSSARIRALWAAFERSLLPAHSTMEHKTHAAHAAADHAYSRLPPSSRPSPAAHAADKAAAARALRTAYYEKAVDGWHRRLADAGLAVEMWTDMTADEMERIEMTLGGADEDSDEDIVVVQPPLPPTPHGLYATPTASSSSASFNVLAPSLTTSTRTTNVSAASSASYVSAASSGSGASYELVKPSEFYSDGEDEEFYPPGFGTPAPDPSDFLTSTSASASASASEASDNDDDDEQRTGRPHPFRAWSSGGSNASSLQNSVASLQQNATHPHPPQRHQRQNSVSHGAKGWSVPASAVATPSAASKNPWEEWGGGKNTSSASASASAAGKTTTTTAPMLNGKGKPPVSQPYIGPQLLTSDDPHPHANGHANNGGGKDNNNDDDDEDKSAAALAFERFKLRTRMLKIVEFHAAAAAAEIRLAAEIWRMRKGMGAAASASSLSARTNNAAHAKPAAAGKARPKLKRAGLFGDEEEEDDGSDRDDASPPSDGEVPAPTPSTLVLAHQRAMAALQAAKEEERKGLVRAERERRRTRMGMGLRSEEKAAAAEGTASAEAVAVANGKPGANAKERRKGRSGTIVSGQPTGARAKADAEQQQLQQQQQEAQSPAASDTTPGQKGNDEAWLDAVYHYAEQPDGRRAGAAGDEKALADALGGRFDLGAILGGGEGGGGVEAFLDGVVARAPHANGVDGRGGNGWGHQPEQEQQHEQRRQRRQLQQQQQDPAAATGWGYRQQPQPRTQNEQQNTPTATSFASAPSSSSFASSASSSSAAHRRRPSTSASASASASVSTATPDPFGRPRAQSRSQSHTAGGGAGTHASIFAPIPVRASPFGESSSDDEDAGPYGTQWGAAAAAGAQGGGWGAASTHGQTQAQGYVPASAGGFGPRHHAPGGWGVHGAAPPVAAVVAPPPLHALERELEPDLMAAFVEYSGVGAGRGSLGAASASSNHSPLGGLGQAHVYGMESAGGATPANAFAAAAEALVYAEAFGNGRGGREPRGRTRTMEPVSLEPAGDSANARAAAGRGSRDASTSTSASAAARSRSRSPTMTRGFPSWATRITGGSSTTTTITAQGPAETAAAAAPARGPTATPISSGWTRKFQKPIVGGHATATPHLAPAATLPHAPTPASSAAAASSMFSLKNPFGFADDAEPAAPMASSWLGKGKKAAASFVAASVGGGGGAQQQQQQHLHAQAQEDEQPEPELSLWEQVTQQKAVKAGLVGGTLGASGSDLSVATGKKALPAVPAPTPATKAEKEKAAVKEKAVVEKEKEKVVEKPAPAPPASKKQTKKQRQAMKKGGSAPGSKAAAEDAPEPDADQEQEQEPAPAVTPAKSKPGSTLAASKLANDDADDDADADANANEDDTEMFSSAHTSISLSKSRALPSAALGGRRRLDSLSQSTASGGWDSESAFASTPRPPPKVPAHLQEVAAAMSAPPPFGLKPLMQAQAENRSGTGMGTIRPRAGSSAPAWGAATNANGAANGQSGGGGRSLWGLFGGGGSAGGDAASVAAPKAQADMWVPGGFEKAEDEPEPSIEGVDDDDGGGGDGGGGESGAWMSMGNGRIQTEKTQVQQPVSLAQRLRRGSEAAAPSPAPRAAGKGATAAPAPSIPATSTVASKKGRAKKGAKGKKVTIEDVPDEDTGNRGEILPVDSRLILDDAQVILEPKPSVPPALFDSIISYTDEEDNKPAHARTSSNLPPADAWGNEAWMSAAAKEIREGTSKLEKASIGGGGVWGADANTAAKPTWGPSASEDAEEQGSPFFSALSGGSGRAAKTAQQTAGGGGVWGQKGKGKLTADSAGGEEAGNGAAKPTIQNLKRNKAAGGKLF